MALLRLAGRRGCTHAPRPQTLQPPIGNLTTALMIWIFEVREDLRCSGDHIGTRIVEQFVDEFDD